MWVLKHNAVYKKIISYLVIIGHLAVGLVILISLQQLKLPDWLNISGITFLAFLMLNLAQSFVFKLNKELKVFWTFRKTPFLIPGIIGGALIAICPVAIGVVAGQLHYSGISLNPDISISSIGITSLIIGWEELWFRGLFLNFCQKHLSSINIALTVGLLFMLIHLLNPKIDLLKTGPTLFFAGALLTLLYFYYKTIWLPAGLHFGNNFMGTVLNTNNETEILFGSEGYIGAIVLAGLFLLYFIKTKKLTANSG